MKSKKSLSVFPKPMYGSDKGKEMSKEMSLNLKTKRIPSRLKTDDVSNQSGRRARGGY